jgi:hypothetical protein
MTRKNPSRDIVVGINNINPEEKCFCVYPHLLNLDGPGSYDYKIDKDFSTIRSQWKGGTFNDALKEKLKRYTPSTCWEGSGACEPNKWFVGAAGTKVNGEQQNAVKLSLEIPKDPLRSPNGRWSFSVEVCEYKPPYSQWDSQDNTRCKKWSTGCTSCIPDYCRQNPQQECESGKKDDCYEWYDSEEFHLEVQSEE